MARSVWPCSAAVSRFLSRSEELHELLLSALEQPPANAAAVVGTDTQQQQQQQQQQQPLRDSKIPELQKQHRQQRRQLLLYNDQYIMKPPRSGAACAFAWHSDAAAASAFAASSYAGAYSQDRRHECKSLASDASCASPHVPLQFLSLWIPLEDVGLNSGGLIVLPGSHLWRPGSITQSSSNNSSSSSSSSNNNSSNAQDTHSCCRCAASCPASGESLPPAAVAASSSSCCCCCAAATEAQTASLPGAGAAPPGVSLPARPVKLQCSQELLALLGGDSMLGQRPQSQQPPLQLLVPAGCGVLFWSSTWHASGPNTSEHGRTAFMPQFVSASSGRKRCCSCSRSGLGDGSDVAVQYHSDQRNGCCRSLSLAVPLPL
jgi:Phytanoyl-CoA dioxygenase (PhyH)